ncbi:hypothetical protein [Spartinivicinus poritis]|uniref:Uncharacterized protein n=1 Tax=Spartinivicinus poritis TaxID=2994640 RepID=A0ABT5U6Q7_9GAMM|nr:hypothetical protein [Spartinivicinus sp. A2-2]MDE1461880.1 hypothetical protein [Spartinivicinus sp. A2-2]
MIANLPEANNVLEVPYTQSEGYANAELPCSELVLPTFSFFSCGEISGQKKAIKNKEILVITSFDKSKTILLKAGRLFIGG